MSLPSSLLPPRSVADRNWEVTEYFHLDTIKQLGGVSVTTNNLPKNKDEATPPSLSVTGKLRHIKPIEVDNFKFLKDQLSKSQHPSAKNAVIKCQSNQVRTLIQHPDS